jgi:hypothetical protein
MFGSSQKKWYVALKYVTKSNRLICLEAVNKMDYHYNMYMIKQKKFVWKQSNKMDWHYNMYVHQTEQICLEAIKEDG